MLPMGWNQIRQARVSDIQQHNNMSYGQPRHPQLMQQNQQQFGMYQQSMMQQHQSFPPQMMGNYGMQDPQLMLGNPPKPPEPEGPPPPSPPAPLPSGEAIPPPPPDDGQWWIAEMKNLPSNQHRHVLERMVGEKWFQTMTTGQQIECWQHKLQLLNKQKKESGGNHSMQKPAIVAAPSVSAPSRLNEQEQPPIQSGSIDQDLQKAREEETKVKQQVLTFEKQYGEWKKQFDDWKDKHKNHPNKQQFVQYETQWMTWQKQMSTQKSEYDNSLRTVQERIQNLERQNSGGHGSNEFSGGQRGPPPGQGLSNQQLDRFPGNQGRPQELSNQQLDRFPGNQGRPQELSNQQPNRFPGNQGGPPPRQGLSNQQMNRFPGNEGQNFNQRPQFRPRFNVGQRPRFDGDQNQGQRFQHPQFNDDNQSAGFTQRPRFVAPGGMDNNSFQHRTPGAFNENQGPRQRFGGPREGGPRFGEGWQGRGPRPRGPFGPRFRNKLPSFMDEEHDYNDDWGEEEQEENYEEENFQQDFFGRNQGIRGPRPGFGPRGGQRGRFPGPRNRPPRPGGPGESMLFRGPRPRFPNSGPRGRFPGPRGPRPPFGGHGNFADDFADDFSRDDNFYNEEEEEETNEQENEGTKDPNTSNKGKGAKARDEWNVSRDMVPLSFGVDRRKRRQNRLDTFTFIDAHKQNTDNQEDETEEFDGKEDDVSEENKDKEDTQDVDPESDYSHYMTDVLQAKHKPASARGRGLPLRRGRGRGDNLLQLRGRGRGHPGRGRGRGRDYVDDFAFEDVATPPHVLMREEGRFNAEKMRRFGDHHDLLGDFPQNRDVPKQKTPPPSSKDTTPFTAISSQNTPTTSSSSAPIDTKAIMQKAKELSNLDIKNLLSAVKSIKGTSQQEETGASGSDMDSEKEKKSQISSISGIENTDEEAAILARERHYEQLARGFEEPGPRHKEKDQLSGDGRLTEADLIAAGLDPVSLGLQDEDLLLQEYLLNPSMRDRFLDPVARDPLLDTVARDPLLDPVARDPYFDPLARDPLIDPVSRDPLLDPLLQDSYLERQLLLREIQEMRQREEARHRQEAKRAEELREALTKPILQAQKIVETIDYSHGLKDSDKKKEEDRDGDKRRTSPPPQRDGFRGSPQRDLPFRGRPYPDFENDRHRFPPISMDERMRMRERDMFPPGMDERMARERGFFPRNPMEERMMRERGMWPPRSPPPRRRSPYDPDSSVVVAEDVGEALDKHWEMLERDRESMERKRHSMERRRNSLERRGSSRERVEERHNRERSLERLRKMEWELKERERMLNERERRLKTPPKKARDNRDRSSWKPEGASNRRSRTPPRRRFEEERSSRDRRFRSRSRSPSPRRGRGRSPVFNRRDRSPRRSPIRGRGGDRRRFSSPSGDPSRTRSPRPPPRKTMKIEPVCVRVEDLLNEPARQLRPKRIVIILRGLPGSGKSHIAKLIRDKESTKGATPRLLGLDDYFMVENEKFEKDPDTGKIVKRKVHEYEYEAVMEPKYRESLLKSFKKTLEDGYFNFVIVDAINDKVSHFSEFWTTAKKSVFEVYVAEITADAHVCAKRNTHKRTLPEIQDLSNKWEETPAHMIRLDVRQMLQDSEIQEVEMGDVSDDEDIGDAKKEKLTPEQLAGIPQSKWELMEANVRLDKLDGIKKKKLTSSHQDMAEFLSVTDDYVQRNSAPGKKRVRWADIQERSAQQRLREVGFVVGQTDWNRLVDGSSHANAALNRTKFI